VCKKRFLGTCSEHSQVYTSVSQNFEMNSSVTSMLWDLAIDLKGVFKNSLFVCPFIVILAFEH
jgi:hypothetical protein